MLFTFVSRAARNVRVLGRKMTGDTWSTNDVRVLNPSNLSTAVHAKNINVVDQVKLKLWILSLSVKHHQHWKYMSSCGLGTASATLIEDVPFYDRPVTIVLFINSFFYLCYVFNILLYLTQRSN